MSSLPVGWTKHRSSKFPEMDYYFNRNTGATVWDLAEITGLGQSVPSPTQEMEFHEDPPPVKRKKIVFDLDSSSKPSVVSHISASNEKSPLKNSNGTTTFPSSVTGQDQDSDEEDSFMVMDDDERQNWKKMESKFLSPERESPKTDEDLNIVPKIPPAAEDNIPFSSKHQKRGFNAENYGFKYQNYENEERPKYQRELSERKSKLSGSFSPIESEFRRSKVLEYFQPEQERTPEYDYDTPEELYDPEDGVAVSDENPREFHAETEMSPQGNVSSVLSSPIEEQGEEFDTSGEDEVSQKYEEDEYIGCEIEAPSSTSFERELEEEERCMEDLLDSKEILKEISVVREILSNALNSEESSEEEEEMRWLSQSVVVLDTNVLLSSLQDLTPLLEYRGELTVMVPWQVRQELDRLQLSQNKVVELRARAAVRWTTSVLQTQSNVQAQTASQARFITSHYQVIRPEDVILDTCKGLLGQGRTVLLATEDVNMNDRVRAIGVKSGNLATISDILTGRETEDFKRVSLEDGEENLLDTSTSDDLAVDKVEDLLTTIWQIILADTIGFAEALGVSHDFDPDQKVELLSREAAAEQLPGFYSSVSELHQSMENLIQTPENDGK